MHAYFVLQAPIRTRAGYLEQEVAVATLTIHVAVELTDAPALALGIPLIHAPDHPGEILGVAPTGPREYREGRPTAVVRVSPAALLEGLILHNEALRLVLIRPEIGRCHQRLNLFYPLPTCLVH